ncbi:MAG: DUF2656 domain-containing protein [Cyanobacteria bacterium J06642_9]
MSPTRLLLSHNFAVSSEDVAPLSRETFFAVFRAGLSSQTDIHCRQVDHPHWIVEILFPAETFSPQQVGEFCAKALKQMRQTTAGIAACPEILVLGGLKTTPATSTAKDALQPGEWGVDVVETESGEAFLQAMQWEAVIAQKPDDAVFKVALKS